MRITKIENQKRHPARKTIYADGKFLAGVSVETLARLALRTGDELSPEQVRVLKKTEELTSARNVALRFLAARPRTVREVRDKLRDREFADSEIRAVTEELKASGLLNDEEFARSYLRDALALKPSGEILLRRKLLLLGISREIIERAMGELLPPEGRAETARKAAETFLKRTLKTKRPEPRQKTRERLAGYLSRRGFSWDIIESVLRESFPAGDE